jgi:hypothetical protein
MRKIFLAVALGGLTALAASGASAAPSAAGLRAMQPQPLVTNVDYYWHHQHYHHRHYEHHQWRYYN